MKTELNEKQIKALEVLIKKVINERIENKPLINENAVKRTVTEKKIYAIEKLIREVLNEEMVSNGITSEGLGDWLHGALKGTKEVVKNDINSVKDKVGNFTSKIGNKVNSVKDGVKSRVDQIKMAGETASQEADTAKFQMEGEKGLKQILDKIKSFNAKFKTNLVLKKVSTVKASVEKSEEPSK